MFFQKQKIILSWQSDLNRTSTPNNHTYLQHANTQSSHHFQLSILPKNTFHFKTHLWPGPINMQLDPTKHHSERPLECMASVSASTKEKIPSK